ncbi:cyclopropane-fatty-acyl-phospholipid synthase family protein [Sphingomonas sp. BK580]|uniref:SAM-dependent methyltransferase n=1 Tax=Sphingomonas sp. BK580 TaxID=2586972 RepID=UPI0016093645|nr:cyclopropane-fatty-acyl-phospholipid synthase family protein [Sphingomonas sp. BK580]MBB3693946.1 cyclopropane-fatty-acyl-phospholipid synthase [Sphingomonas sp. BK580]
MALIDVFLSRAIKRGRLTLTKPDGSTASFGSDDPALKPVAIRITDRSVYRALVADPALGAGESFMDGKLIVEQGDILDLLLLATSNSRWENGVNRLAANRWRTLKGQIRHRLTGNQAKASKRNVAHHYDLSDRLYDLFLDADKQYSCAYYTDPTNSLEQAQADKKAHIVAKLALKPGMRVLDIGCGWGGMALYIHARTGAEVLGITLSEEQLKVARRRAEEAGVADKVKFELIDYRALEGPFDRIVSVGMFEHVGLRNFRTYLSKCRDLLTPDGVMLLHTIGRADGPNFTDKFTDKYIFPGGYIPALSEVLAANEFIRWFVTDVEVLRMHYAMTLRAWYERTVAERDAIVALYDERFFRMWTFYLAGAIVSFTNGPLVNYQIQFSRDRLGLPLTRDYMIEEERRLRGS